MEETKKETRMSECQKEPTDAQRYGSERTAVMLRRGSDWVECNERCCFQNNNFHL